MKWPTGFLLLSFIHCLMSYVNSLSQSKMFAAAVAQWVRPFARQTEGWVFEPQPRQIVVIKTGSDTSTAK